MTLTNEQISAQSGYIAGSYGASQQTVDINKQLDIINKNNYKQSEKNNNIYTYLILLTEEHNNKIKNLKYEIYILKKIIKKILKKLSLLYYFLSNLYFGFNPISSFFIL